MEVKVEEKYLKKRYSASKIAAFLDVSVVTLNNWYKWYYGEFEKPADTPVLPMYFRASDRGPRYWTEDDLYDLKKFKEWIPKGRRGVMGDVTSYAWGDRGRRARENKLKKQEGGNTDANSGGVNCIS